MRYLSAILLLVWLAPAGALTIVPELNLNLSQLTPEQRAPLFDLEERLVSYLSSVDWDPDERTLQLRVPVAIQLRSAAEGGSGTIYTALFAGGNKGDLTIDEGTWRFRIPDGRFQHSEDSFDPFLSMLDFEVLMVVAHEYDKLAEFGGTPIFERARRLASQAQFSEFQDGWDNRAENVERILDPRGRDLRTLRWVTHTAWWFRDKQKSPYEAWKTVRLALDLAERMDNPNLLTSWFKANHRSLVEVLVAAKDDEGLRKLSRMDTLDLQRNEAYRDALARVSR